MGIFTHFTNVLDLCAIAVPVGVYKTEGSSELPFGITFLGAWCMDSEVIRVAERFSEAMMPES